MIESENIETSGRSAVILPNNKRPNKDTRGIPF